MIKEGDGNRDAEILKFFYSSFPELLDEVALPENCRNSYDLTVGIFAEAA